MSEQYSLSYNVPHKIYSKKMGSEPKKAIGLEMAERKMSVEPLASLGFIRDARTWYAWRLE